MRQPERDTGSMQQLYGTAISCGQGHNTMYQTNDFQLTNMDNWNGKVESQTFSSNHFQVHEQGAPFSLSRTGVTVRASGNAAFTSANYGGVQNTYNRLNYNNNMNENSRFYHSHVNEEHLSTPRGNQTSGSHIERNSATKLFNPFALNPEISETWPEQSSQERNMTGAQRSSYNYPGLNRNNSFTQGNLQATTNELRGNNSIAGIDSTARPLSRTPSSVLIPDIPTGLHLSRIKSTSNVSSFQNLHALYQDSTREFSQNAIIRSIQSSSTEKTLPNPAGNMNAPSNPYADYFKAQKFAEKIVPPVVKVEEGYDRPVPAKRTHSLKFEKSSIKISENSNNNRFNNDNPFSNDNPFTNNWIVQKSESQRIMEEHLATMTEARDWQETFHSGVSRSKNTEAVKATQEVEASYKCDWTNCGLIFPEQDDLVRHIEKVHIDQRKADDSFVCFWENCVRKQKPFNARYKLVIHMRVHSGERPNRCTVGSSIFSSIIINISRQ